MPNRSSWLQAKQEFGYGNDRDHGFGTALTRNILRHRNELWRKRVCWALTLFVGDTQSGVLPASLALGIGYHHIIYELRIETICRKMPSSRRHLKLCKRSRLTWRWAVTLFITKQAKSGCLISIFIHGWAVPGTAILHFGVWSWSETVVGELNKKRIYLEGFGRLWPQLA